jgi:MFS family permease
MEARDPKRWVALAVVLTATLLSIVSVFISNVALPVMQQDLSASAGQAQMILAGYNLMFGLFLVIGGRLGDFYGIRRVFLLGLTLFTAASAVSGFAPGPGSLIASRAVQGLGAALMIPQVMSFIQVYFTGKERGVALGAYAAVGGFGSTAAQLLGGWLIAADWFGLGWRMIYLLNVPVGLLAMLAAMRILRERIAADRNDRRSDWTGAALVTAALSALCFPLTFGNDLGWPWWIFGLLLVSPVLAFAFVRHQMRLETSGRQAPLISPSLFRRKGFTAGNLSILLFYANNAVLFIVMPLFLQRGLGMTPFQSGLVFAPLALGFALTSMKSGGWAAAFGHRTLTAGCLLLGASYLLFYATNTAFGPDLSGYEWIPAALLAGVAMGLISAPLNFLTLAHVKEHETGQASGIITAGVEIAYALGTVAGGMIFFSVVGTDVGGVSGLAGGTDHSAYVQAVHSAIGFNGLLVIGLLVLIRYLKR